MCVPCQLREEPSFPLYQCRFILIIFYFHLCLIVINLEAPLAPCNIEINRKDLPLLIPYCIIYGQPLIGRSRVFSTRSCAQLHGYYIKAAHPSHTISTFYDRNKPYQLSPAIWVPFLPTLWEELSFLFIMADYWIVVTRRPIR